MRNLRLSVIGLFLITQSALSYDHQPKTMKLLIHPGKVATATLDEIDLSQLEPILPLGKRTEHYRSTREKPIYLTVDQLRYRLVAVERTQIFGSYQLEFSELETGQELVVKDETIGVRFYTQGIDNFAISARVTESY